MAVQRPTAPPLTPGEWAVLGALGEGPTHGFALARLLGADGALGRVWSLPRPVVYQTLKKLMRLGLVTPAATQPGDRGPTRTIVAVTPQGQALVTAWLGDPVLHVRDIRSELLLKLALLERSGRDSTELVEAQRAVLRARRVALSARLEGAEGFDQVIAVWRLASVDAVTRFLDALGEASVLDQPSSADLPTREVRRLG